MADKKRLVVSGNKLLYRWNSVLYSYFSFFTSNVFKFCWEVDKLVLSITENNIFRNCSTFFCSEIVIFCKIGETIGYINVYEVLNITKRSYFRQSCSKMVYSLENGFTVFLKRNVNLLDRLDWQCMYFTESTRIAL